MRPEERVFLLALIFSWLKKKGGRTRYVAPEIFWGHAKDICSDQQMLQLAAIMHEAIDAEWMQTALLETRGKITGDYEIGDAARKSLAIFKKSKAAFAAIILRA